MATPYLVKVGRLFKVPPLEILSEAGCEPGSRYV